jgi:hypothetical protein
MSLFQLPHGQSEPVWANNLAARLALLRTHAGLSLRPEVFETVGHHGMWVFDDPRVGLVQEPFVAGADTMIDRVVADIPDADMVSRLQHAVPRTPVSS